MAICVCVCVWSDEGFDLILWIAMVAQKQPNGLAGKTVWVINRDQFPSSALRGLCVKGTTAVILGSFCKTKTTSLIVSNNNWHKAQFIICVSFNFTPALLWQNRALGLEGHTLPLGSINMMQFRCGFYYCALLFFDVAVDGAALAHHDLFRMGNNNWTVNMQRNFHLARDGMNTSTTQRNTTDDGIN